MHALIADTLPAETRAGLESLGLRVTEDASLGSHNLPGAVADVDILIVGKTRVSRRAIEAAPNLRLIVRAASGTDTIDVVAAAERGIFVSHCAAADAHARAEMVFALVLGLDRQLHQPHGSAPAPAQGLRGRSLGLYGYDSTARAVQHIAEGFGMRVHVYAPGLTTALASEHGVRRCETMGQLFTRCEVVSLHPPADSSETITAAHIDALGQGGTLINISRRDLIDLGAAKAALDAGTIRLALDVYDADDYSDEVPLSVDGSPRFMATDGTASFTAEASDAIGRVVVDLIEKYVLTDVVPDCVNATESTEAKATLVLRYHHGHAVLASILEAIRDAEANVLGIETQLFDALSAAWAKIQIDAPPSPALIAAIERNSHVIALATSAG